MRSRRTAPGRSRSSPPTTPSTPPATSRQSPSTGHARRPQSTPTRPHHKPDRRHLHLQLKRRRLRPSRCASTAAPGSPAPAPSSTAASATALTPSTCAQPTPPATPTSPPPPSPGPSTPPHPTRPSHRSPATRQMQREPPSPSPPARAPRPSSASLDGGALGRLHDAELLRLAREGAHSFEVRATDAAANTDATPATFNWSIDLTNPTGSMTSPANAARVRATILLASSSADGGSGLASVVFERSPAGAGTWTATPASWDTTLLADGDYDLRVMTSDVAGNVTVSAVITVTVDNTPPNTSITSQPADPTNATGASFAFSSEAGASYEVRLDGGAWIPSASPKIYSGLARGHLHLRGARDRRRGQRRRDAGLVHVDGRHDARRTRPSPRRPPSVEPDRAQASRSRRPMPARASRLASTAAPVADCQPEASTAGLTEGAHTFEVRATDAGRQPGRDAGELHLDGRPDCPEHVLRVDAGQSERDTTPTFGFGSTESPPRSSATSTAAAGRRARRP